MNKQQSSYLFAGLSILAWSTVSTAFKLTLKYCSPLGLLLMSSLIATVLLAIMVLISKQGFGSFFQNMRRSTPAGLLNPYLYYVILFTAYSRLRAQEAQALNYTWAIVLSVLMVLFMRERFRIKDLGALLFSFLGVLIISAKGHLLDLRFDDTQGTLLALGSSLVWASYWMVNLRDNRENTLKLFYNFLVGSILIMTHVLIFQSQILLKQDTLIPAMLGAMWVGVFEMGLTFILWLKALQYTENSAKITNLIFLTPFVSMFMIQSILKESIHPATIVGLLLIVGSNLLQKYYN